MADESSVSQQQASSADKSPGGVPNQPQVPEPSGSSASPSGDFQTFPYLYPQFIPGLVPPLQNQEHMNHGPGIYAVPVLPNMGPIVGVPFKNLIPLTYNIPTGPSSSEAGRPGEEQRPVGQVQQQPQAAPQRQVVVRRFQIAFQIDLFLMLKLAAVIFLFNQDGSRQRLVALVFFAALIYLYQTGALTPLIRWLSQGMQRPAAPPQPPRHAARAENDHTNDNADLAEGPAGAENGARPVDDVNRVVENENRAEPGGGNGGNQWWGIVKEIQMIVFGFITSLLPGFQNHLD